MARYIVVFCALVACTTAKQSAVAPLAYTAPLAATALLAYSAPIPAAPAPLAYSAVPVAYTNAHLDAAYASNRVDVRENYNAALVPTTFAAAAPAKLVAPVAAAPAPLAYSAVPVAYTNAHLDAAYASNRVDVRENYNAALVPTTFAAAAPAKLVSPVAAGTAPLAYSAVPVAYTNAHLDAAYASNRVDVRENYNAALVPTTFAAAAPSKLVSPVAAGTAPLAYSAVPVAYTNAHLDAAYASNRVDVRENYNAALVPTTFAAAAPSKLVATVAAGTAPLVYSAVPVAYTKAHLDPAKNYNAAAPAKLVAPSTYAASPVTYAAAPMASPVAAPVASVKYNNAQVLW